MILVFLPAGSLKFINGWLFIGLLFIPMFIMGIVMLFKNPALLEKRLNTKEKEKEQRGVVAVSGIMFLSGFIIAGLDHRFGWLSLHPIVIIIDTYLSRTIEVQKSQKVIDTGLYGIVRHPMYSATILMFLSIPLVLGSLFSFLIFLIYPFAIAFRIKNEETVLENGLEGYAEYKKKVKYRLIPFIW